MTGEICNFCLGGDTDVPPFGNVKDAEDLIHPCSTCSLVTHKKCLLDWFNSLSAEKLQMVNATTLDNATGARRRRNESDLEDDEVNQTRIHINLSSQLLGNFITSIRSGIGNPATLVGEGNLDNEHCATFLFATCPQCRGDIIFSMHVSRLLAFNQTVKNMMIRSVQFSGVFLGFTSAVTGIISMGYVGLTTCGLKMIDSLVPGPLLMKLLTKRYDKFSPSAYSSLSRMLLGDVQGYKIDNLEQALLKGLIDPLKFSRIPVLPIVLYRMRSSSIVNCIFGSKDAIFNDWVTELMISGYISSLGSHQLLRGMVFNINSLITRLIRNPGSITQGVHLLEGIDLFTTNNMISLMVPVRWGYDFFRHMVLNRFHFNIAMSASPRRIADSVSSEELDTMEDLGAKLGKIELEYRALKRDIRSQVDKQLDSSQLQKLISKNLLMFKIFFFKKYPLNYVNLKLQLWLHQAKACLKNDYSESFLSRSFSLRLLSTTIWPFVSAKVGSLLFSIIAKFIKTEGLTREKGILASNLVGLVLVVLIKDLFNLYMSHRRAKQLAQIRVLRISDDTGDYNIIGGDLPGAFQN